MQGQSAVIFLPLLFLTAVEVNSKLPGNKGLNVYDMELWHEMKNALNNRGIHRPLKSNGSMQPNKRDFMRWEDILFCGLLWDCDESSEEVERLPLTPTQEPSTPPSSPTPPILVPIVPVPSTSTPPPFVSNCPEIPEDYSRFKCTMHAYKFHEEKLPWNEAQQQCQEESGQLVVIENGAQYDSVIELMEREMEGSIAVIHVGFHRKSPSDPWKTVYGDYVIFEKWASFMPNDEDDSEECGAFVFFPNGPQGHIYGTCHRLHSYMCEIKLPSNCT